MFRNCWSTSALAMADREPGGEKRGSPNVTFWRKNTINKYGIIISSIKRSQMFLPLCLNKGKKEKAERNESCLHFKVD